MPPEFKFAQGYATAACDFKHWTAATLAVEWITEVDFDAPASW